MKFRFTPRMGLYSFALVALASVLVLLLATRGDVSTILLRAPGALYTQNANGEISNLYTVKVLNKTSRQLPITFRLENATGTIQPMGSPQFLLARESMAETALLISLKPESLEGPSTKLKIGIYSNGRRLEVVNTVFAGPRTTLTR